MAWRMRTSRESAATWVGRYRKPAADARAFTVAVTDGKPAAGLTAQCGAAGAIEDDHPELPRLNGRKARVNALLEKIDREGEDARHRSTRLSGFRRSTNL